MQKGKKPLRSKTQLKAKAPLKAKAGLKKVESLKKSTSLSKVSRKPRDEWGVREYKKEATKYFNRAVKYRDSEEVDGKWIFNCITCDRRVLFSYIDEKGDRRYVRTAHAGHFMPETRNNTRYDEENVNGQCGSCNYNQGEQYRYALALDLKYGTGKAAELEKLSKIPKQFTIQELLEIIADSKEQIRFYEKEA